MKDESVQIQRRGLPETINIHLTRSCNFGCRFCYAEFAECGSRRIPPDQLRSVLEAISRAGPLPSGCKRKVNFAGGEPLLYYGLPGIIQFCKQLGLVTSLVTNGSLLAGPVFVALTGALNICAVSVDSGAAETNGAIGRCGRGFRPDAGFYRALAERIRGAGMKFKVNTVVNRLNLSENLGDLVGTRLRVVRKRSRAANKTLDARELGSNRRAIDRRAGFLWGLFIFAFNIVLKVTEHVCETIIGAGLSAVLEAAQTRGNVLQAGGQSRY